ncbi:MAG: hypothetical protein PUF72_03760 [Clostridiales bacterium]|nr:hypothetical protein [Clostridiales bacterium]
MEDLTKQIEEAKKLLNDNDYLVIPITKGQMCLCDGCREESYLCRYNAIGYTCTNLICLNQYIKEQINYKEIIANIE